MANYMVIGSDGVQTGPASPEDLRRWMSEGRVDTQTKVQAFGTTEWVLLGSIPEFAGTVKSPASPPPLPPGVAPVPSKMSVMAVLSLVFGILGLVTCVTSLVGLILGIIAMVKISNSKGALRGWGLALTGIILSTLAVLVAPALLLPALSAAKQKALVITCLNNERQLMMAVNIYASQHTNQYPPAATWCDAIQVPSETIFKCIAANSSNRCDYAFNSRLGGMDKSKISPNTAVIFESDGGWDANGGPELMAGKPRHGQSYCVVFADNHAEMVPASGLGNLRWDP